MIVNSIKINFFFLLHLCIIKILINEPVSVIPEVSQSDSQI